jgi:cell division protein FtsB
VAKRSDTPGRIWLRRLAWGAGGVAVLWFTLEGGEWGTSDLWRQRAAVAALEDELAQTRDSVDALRAEVKAVTTDPARLEKLAREEYGMVKGEKELLYRIRRTGADSAVVVKDSSSR